ncbi:MAG: Metalloenzyme, LuxS/M16 peptidase-like protein [Monoraphidium minutum]|nr:MAG: Metalloenzyme, LuxS/M16 peptidase-like protein [Monoraphidium minutum]
MAALVVLCAPGPGPALAAGASPPSPHDQQQRPRLGTGGAAAASALARNGSLRLAAVGPAAAPPLAEQRSGGQQQGGKEEGAPRAVAPILMAPMDATLAPTLQLPAQDSNIEQQRQEQQGEAAAAKAPPPPAPAPRPLQFAPMDPGVVMPPPPAAPAAPKPDDPMAGAPSLVQPAAQQLKRLRPPAPTDAAAPGGALLDEDRIAAVYERLPPLPGGAPPLPALADPDIKRITLPNGLRLLLLRDGEVPLVRGSLLMGGGQAASPGDKVGLASITAAVQRSGGSLQHPGPALDSRLDDLAAAIEASAGPRAVSIDFECASEDAQEVLGLLAELAAAPALPQDRLDVTRGQVLESLAHKDDVASELRKLVLGPDSPWARTPTVSGINSITRQDLQDYWAAWERPDAAVLGIVGDFEPAAMEAVVRAAFEPWAPAPGEPAAPRPPPGGGGGGGGGGAPAAAAAAGKEGVVWLIDRPGAAQASVAAGERGVSLLAPDAYALSALNGVLNSFGGSLFDTLRTRDGLCYSVSGGWELPFDHEGMFIAAGETSQPAPFLKGLRSVLADAAAAAPPAERLERAKREKLNSFIFNFATPGAQLQRAAAYELLGVPRDFLLSYRAGIDAVGAADVLAAAGARLHPAEQVAVVVGDAGAARAALEAAGFEVRPLVPRDE